jgi:hypothetical protein
LAERIGEAERVVFVDAGQDDAVPNRPIEPGQTAQVMGHTGEPRGLLALAESLYGRRPEVWLITLPAPELGFGEGLSAAAFAPRRWRKRVLAGARNSRVPPSR